MDRTRVWLAVSPVIGAGVLVAHALAYRLTGTSSGSLHAYLGHAPQLLVVLAVIGLALAGFGARLRSPSPWLFPAAAVATFAVQEHLERLVHSGELASVVTSPAFLVGLVLQIPVAVLAWALARRLLGALGQLSARRVRLPHLSVGLVLPSRSEVEAVAARRLQARGPPSFLRP